MARYRKWKLEKCRAMIGNHIHRAKGLKTARKPWPSIDSGYETCNGCPVQESCLTHPGSEKCLELSSEDRVNDGG